MNEQHGIDAAGGLWTQVFVGEVVLDSDAPWEDGLRVFLWRRIPSPVPPRMTEADYTLQVVVEYQGEQFTFGPDQADRVAAQLPILLQAAAVRARQG
jgi:hypothetical protein